MAWLVAVILLPLVFALTMVYVVLKVALFLLRVAFAPVVFLGRR
jgi:hypothetical protein